MPGINKKKKNPLPVISDELAQKLYRKAKKRKSRRIVFLVLLALLIAFAVAAYAVLFPVYQRTKDAVYEILSNMTSADFIREGNTLIYDSDGILIGEYGYEEYEYVTIDQISDYITYGYIAREDKNFTTHPGIDIMAIARAGIAYIANGGEITQGGSTITQQLVKNSLLTQEQTFTRKITEIFLALEVEKNYTKADIMELYCNSCYYGNSCYGVEAAARYYFGKSASTVTLAEAAIIVATSNSPNNYNPVANYELSMERKNLVLADMLEEGYITQEEYEAACAEEPEILQQTTEVEQETDLVTYATHCAALKMMENDGFEFQYVFTTQEEQEAYEESYSAAYNDALEEIRTGGYEIYTSFDLTIQKELQDQIDDGLSGFTETSDSGIYSRQAAAVCIDNETQMVVAIVGGRSGSGEYNRGYQATRQPGSAIKPILDYGPALDNGTIYPGLNMIDEETTVNGYTPKNSGGSYRGSVTVREALVRSINTIALQIFDNSGGFDNLSYLEQMRFSSLSYADSTATAISIGGFTNGVTVSDMAKAYATIANGGDYSYNDCIVSIQTYTGEVIYQASDSIVNVYSEDTAFMLSDMMNGLFEERYGSGYGLSSSEQVYAGKTGTTDNNYDAWFCGFSAYYTTAIWIGYDYPAELGFYGSDYPLEIWVSFMDIIHEGLTPTVFDCPDTIKLVNSSGDIIDANYTGYDSRPSGYDYTSGLIIQEQERILQEQEADAILEAAEAAVAEFEAYQITNTTEARNLDTAYSNAYAAVDLVADTDTRAALLERLSYKYSLLNGEVIETWLEAIAAEEEAEQDRLDAENAIQAQKSLEQASEAIKTARIDLVNYYVDILNSCTIYSENVEAVCEYAENALAKCTSYSEYSSLRQSVTTAINWARALPEEDESDDTDDTNNSVIIITGDGSDSSSSSDE